MSKYSWEVFSLFMVAFYEKTQSYIFLTLFSPMLRLITQNTKCDFISLPFQHSPGTKMSNLVMGCLLTRWFLSWTSSRFFFFFIRKNRVNKLIPLSVGDIHLPKTKFICPNRHFSVLFSQLQLHLLFQRFLRRDFFTRHLLRFTTRDHLMQNTHSPRAT